MEIYLDNSATTKCRAEVAALAAHAMTEEYGNPSSMHHKGVAAEGLVREAAERIAGTLKCRRQEILFTSGGTESDNLALAGVARANRRAGRHLVTTEIEHPAVLETMRQLEEEGFEVTYLPVDAWGRVSPEALAQAVRPDTLLVSMMHVNNEIGAVEPVAEAGALIKKRNPRTYFHVDAVQGYGKLPLAPGRMKIDLLSVSAHKLHGPKGVGFLYVRSGVKLLPILYGGGQQGGLRSGTDNVPGIAGLGLAAEKLCAGMEEDGLRLYALKRAFTEAVGKWLPECRVNGQPAWAAASGEAVPQEGLSLEENARLYGAPHIISLSVPGVRAEVLLHALEEKGIYVSAGSACASNRPHVSGTLQAIGLDQALLESTIRLSMSIFTTKEEIDITVEALREIVPRLQRYARD